MDMYDNVYNTFESRWWKELDGEYNSIFKKLFKTQIQAKLAISVEKCERLMCVRGRGSLHVRGECVQCELQRATCDAASSQSDSPDKIHAFACMKHLSFIIKKKKRTLNGIYSAFLKPFKVNYIHIYDDKLILTR